MTADRFSRDLIISGTLHVAVAAMIFLKAVFLPGEPINLQSAIRVDIVGLPEKMPEMTTLPPKPVEAKPEPPAAKLPPKVEVKPEPTKPEAVPLKTTKPTRKDLAQAQKSALEKLKRQAAIDKINKELTESKRAAGAAQIKGNEVTDGNSLTGLKKLDYNRYTEELRSRVLGNFTIDKWLEEANLKAQVLIMIDERGYVTKKVMRKSSGNEIFDGRVIEAIEASSPLPAPPDGLRGVLATSGVVLNFPEE